MDGNGDEFFSTRFMARMLDPNMQLGCGNGDRVQSEVAYLSRSLALAGSGEASELRKCQKAARINFHPIARAPQFVTHQNYTLSH
jgi:hypothetical protein